MRPLRVPSNAALFPGTRPTREAELRDALDAARIPPAAFEARGMGFMDGAADVRAFRRAVGVTPDRREPSLY